MLLWLAACGRSSGVADDDLGGLVIAPKGKPDPVDVDRASQFVRLPNVILVAKGVIVTDEILSASQKEEIRRRPATRTIDDLKPCRARMTV